MRSKIVHGLAVRVALVLGLSAAGVAAPASAQKAGSRGLVGSAFTFQGRLTDGGQPASGLFDFELRLFDGEGTLVAGPIAKDDVTLTDGLFTVELDFGQEAFDGQERLLETAVRPGASTGAYTTLSPRQSLTATPHALALPGVRIVPGPASPNVIGGFSGNSVSDGVSGAAIGGGGQDEAPNRVSDDFGTIGGGFANFAGDNSGTTADHQGATIGGGANNLARGSFSTIGGGNSNSADGAQATVGGGFGNLASGDNTAVGGGFGNLASGDNTAVGGGFFNTASGDNAAVGGGLNNLISGDNAAVGGGQHNTASGDSATVGGGQDNIASGPDDSVGGGEKNTAGGGDSTVAGGQRNTASGNRSTVGGGESNTAGGLASTVPGGHSNAATADYSFAAGRRAKANHDGAFVWADSTDEDFASDRANQFKLRAGGGVHIVAQAAGLNPAALRVESTTGNGVAIFATQNSSDAALVVTNTGTGDLIRAFGTATGGNLRFQVQQNGDVRADGTIQGGGADFAELLPAAAGLEPGDVLAIGPDGALVRSTEAYQAAVAGVHSTRPGFVGDITAGQAGTVPLAVVGIVPVKASAENGPIRPGDLLVASSTPGRAMKASADPPSGTVLGKALELLPSGTGTIRMLAMLQ